MSTLVLGVPLDDCKIQIRRFSKQAFSVAWYNTPGSPPTDPSDLTGRSFVISLGDRDNPTHEWTATNNANVSTWTLTAADTDFDKDFYGGVMLMEEGDPLNPTLLFRVQVEVED